MKPQTAFERATLEWEQGNLRQALELFEQAAGQGDASACNNIGIFYWDGLGVQRDDERARRWLLKAARKGSTTAFQNLALWYRQQGKQRTAIRWLLKTAEAGDGEALFELAKIYRARRSRAQREIGQRYLARAAECSDITDATREVILDLIQNDNASKSL